MCNGLHFLPTHRNRRTQHFLRGKDFSDHADSVEITVPLLLMSRSPPVKKGAFPTGGRLLDSIL